MSRFVQFLIAAVLTAAVFVFLNRDHTNPDSLSVAPAMQAHQCPMHPWVKAVNAAKCNVCGMDLVVGSSSASATDIIMLPQGSPNVVGVQTAEVKKQPLLRTLRISGMIGEDMSRHGIISAPVEGRIDGLAMNHAGQAITRRQPLATIFSRTLLSAANDYNLALK